MRYNEDEHRCIKCSTLMLGYGPKKIHCSACDDRFRRMRWKAQRAVRLAIKAGLLPKQSTLKCRDCGAQASCYEHRDYEKPLEVVPVCQSCNIVRGPAINAFETCDHKEIADFSTKWPGRKAI